MNIDPATSAEATPPPADAAPAPVAVPAAPAAAAPKLTVGQRLAAASAAIGGKGVHADIEALRSQLLAVTGERDALLTSQAALKAELVTVKADLAEAESAVTNFEAKVAASSVELVASAGVPVKQLPAAEASGAAAQPMTRDALEAKMVGKSTAEALQMLREFNAAQSGKN